MSEPVFHVREVPVHGDLILSPMDGYSDQPFRSLCRSLGSAMSYTEFINAIDVMGYHPQLQRKLTYQLEERPVVYQLFDDDPQRLLAAALKLERLGPDIIDVNMGCSARCVSGRGAGAGLLRQPEKVALIFSSLTRALKTPVTAKIRLGWDDESRNFRLIARIVEENGGSLIAVHGRTRAQAYKGEADWDAIAEVRQAVSIPVVGNGDVRTVDDIRRIKAHTGCTAVMIGRAAIGNPWIFSRLDRGQAPPDLVLATMQRHLQSMLDFYGLPVGLHRFRKHADRYLEPYGLPADVRHALMTEEDPDEFRRLLAAAAA